MVVSEIIKGMPSSVKIRDFRYFCIAPEVFEIVSLSDIRKKHMDKSVTIIDDDPLGIAVTVIVVGLDVSIFKKILSDAVGYCADLHR